jgi:hypothetical protein
MRREFMSQSYTTRIDQLWLLKPVTKHEFMKALRHYGITALRHYGVTALKRQVVILPPLNTFLFPITHGGRDCKLFGRPVAYSLRIARDSSSILTESLMTASTRRATSLRAGQFKHLIRVASVTGRLPEHDVMLLWLTHTTGIRVTELALLEVADLLYPSIVIKLEMYLRADITKGCRPRNVYLTTHDTLPP